MRLRLSRKTWLALIAGLVVAVVVVAGAYIYRLALVGSGFMAETLCAGLFISERDPQDVLATDLSGPGYELLRFLHPLIDHEEKVVSVSLYGLASQTAIFRDGLGCTLLADKSAATLRDEAEDALPPSKPANQDILWPEGDQVVPGTLPDWVDGAALEKAIDALFEEPDPDHPRGTRAVVVVHNGRIVAERYAKGFDAAMPLIGWSMTKAATNALIGMRIKDGRLALDDRGLMPEWRGPDDPRRDITLDDLMRMASGLAFDESYKHDLSDVVMMLFVEGDAGAFAASKALEHPPGTHWSYSSGTTNILSRILRETFADERAYLRFPRERLFEPLGMTSAVLQPDASGTFVGSSFLYASARDWARLGLLFLRDGVWLGERILPEGWLAYSLKPTGISPEDQYGAHLWLKLPKSAEMGEPPMPPDAFYMLGHDRQVVAMVPSRDLVIVRLGLTRAGADWDNARDLAPIVNAFPARSG